MMLLQLLKKLLLLINMVLLLLPIWLAKVTKNVFIFAKDGVIAAVQDGATKQELFLLRMVLLLLLEMTGNGATAAPSSPLRHIQPDTKMIQSFRGHSVEVVPLFLGRERRLMPVCGGSAVFYSFSDFADFLR